MCVVVIPSTGCEHEWIQMFLRIKYVFRTNTYVDNNQMIFANIYYYCSAFCWHFKASICSVKVYITSLNHCLFDT